MFSVLVVTGCSVTPATTLRNPYIGTVATTGIGDTIYIYKKNPQVFNDYINMKKTNQTNGFQQEIIYSGLANSELKILYREYVNDLARPTFFQEETYSYSPPRVPSSGDTISIFDIQICSATVCPWLESLASSPPACHTMSPNGGTGGSRRSSVTKITLSISI